MRKIILIISIVSSIFAFNVNDKVHNLIGDSNYFAYQKLIGRLFNNSKDKNIEVIIKKLVNNGLLDIFFKSPRLVHTDFVFVNGENHIFETKTLYDSLEALGYYYFYPYQIKKSDNNYSIGIEYQGEHFIEPLSFLKEMKSRGCFIKDLNRKSDKFIYTLDCTNIKLKNPTILKDKKTSLVKASGVYWIENNGFNSILIITKRYDFWHPYVVFYDENLNIINIINSDIIKRKILAKIDDNCKYIKIMDNFNKINIKRGIIVKGLK